MITGIVIVGAILMFLFQTVCFRAANPSVKWAPLGFLGLGVLWCIGEYVGIFPWNDGSWHELGAVILAIFLGCISSGVVLAWIVYFIKRKMKLKK